MTIQELQDEDNRGCDARKPGSVPRISSRELLAGAVREIEIEHEGRIYRLRLTQSNKLILTA